MNIPDVKIVRFESNDLIATSEVMTLSLEEADVNLVQGRYSDWEDEY